MDIFVFFARFLYRIRYKLVLGTLAAVVLTIYLTGFLPKIFNVTTTIFTGITSKASVDDMSGNTDWNASNNAHENIINIAKSKSTLEAISVKLLAQHLVYGDPNKNNKYIYASNYIKLLKIVHKPVLDLVDRNSYENTLNNLIKYRKEEQGNFVYDIFNWDNKYYGYLSLSKIQVVRRGYSDMIDITYQSDDPAITTNTLIFLNEELIKRYETLLLSASNDVVKHFEEQLALAKLKLEMSEDELAQFNLDNKIINYEEQTKHLVALNNAIEIRYEEALLTSNSSKSLMDELDSQMEARTKLILENELFIKQLSIISDLNGKIAEIEIFDSGGGGNNSSLIKYRDELSQAEARIKEVSQNMDQLRFTKEGIAIEDIVSKWLDALVSYEKSKAELAVMDKRREGIIKVYEQYSPVGPILGKQNRNVRVEEEAYLTILHHLGLAKLKQKNVLLDAGTIQVVTAPTIPLLVVPRKRPIYVIASFFGAIIFIIGLYLVIEFVDRTYRDGPRTERLLGGKIIGVFPSSKQIKHRRFSEEVKKIATANLASSLNRFIIPGKPLIINVLAIDPKDGESLIVDYLLRYWQDREFNVVVLTAQDELIPGSKQLLQASQLGDISQVSSKIEGADVIIAVYAPLGEQVVPSSLLNEASVNMLILNAERACQSKDKSIYDNTLQSLKEDNLFICLNNVDRDTLEQYTGQLPPYNKIRGLMYRFLNLGLTSKS